MILSTIFALATASGKAGVAIIRISGPNATNALKEFGVASKLLPRFTKFAKLYHPLTLELIDEAIVVWFAAPHSFTGEDVVELHIHGSRAVVNSLIEVLSHIADFRLAEAGEFSLRRFNNGKMDLTQAEGLADLIDAETKHQQRQALRQMSGELEKLYENWRGSIIHLLSLVEAYIDFPDQDLPDYLIAQIDQSVNYLKTSISNHLNDGNKGEKIRDGLYVTIIGAPNVGKSSLLNILAKRDVAIVSNIAGTTRDIIEVKLDINGFSVILADTAGLRESDDVIENEGIKRAIKRAEHSDFKIAIFDASTTIADAATLQLLDDKTIVIFNKIDQGIKLYLGLDLDVLNISLLNNQDVEKILKAIQNKAELDFLPSSDPTITRDRHRKILLQVFDVIANFSLQKDIELIAEDLRIIANLIGQITGRIDLEEVLDQIFSQFCIGK